LLHAVAGGANDFKLGVVAGIAESIEDVVGLPEGELGAMVFLSRIRDERVDGSSKIYLRG